MAQPPPRRPGRRGSCSAPPDSCDRPRSGTTPHPRHPGRVPRRVGPDRQVSADRCRRGIRKGLSAHPRPDPARRRPG
ncbi:MAG TPA: hypothetical protein DCM86_08060 [Verrucomicrobiales bacterium]|nr:hypothetical protein [Verrucomicrobiales bacterium]